MATTNPGIPSEVAAHVLSHFGRGGYPAGDWTESLITLIDRADMVHRAKLTTAFPAYGAAIALAKYDENGITTLQRLAGLTPVTIRCARCNDEDGPFTDEQLCEPCARPMPLDGVA
ncbi:hypothetical protein [Streptomyces lancefieldiae]|uniref:Uncharacterized protein n=1 Tax=Streptomyces lancefieldiae TaxID=3075520 RepID=A0ABU3AF27_9ACTN|nr:hypothetical protein [Streptomyces sp. DSM 40712]MDT0608787.1 hypothetical protein [Streptomyces sp. DSM 40712]